MRRIGLGRYLPRISRTRMAAAAVLLLAAAAPSGAQDPPKARNWKITVGPGPCDLTENSHPAPTQTISKKGQHKIAWVSNAGQSLKIVLHVPAKCPAPFKHMTQTGTDANGDVLWTVNCSKDGCKTGPAVKEACEREYKYDQILGDKSCDGRMIIQP
jgi:hypothetical protein